MTAASANTRWSLVEQAKGDTPQARTALSELCAIYYAPVRSVVRHWCPVANEVDDLTHAFFARVLAGHALDGADAERGRFRSYLFCAVKHFIYEQHRSERTTKRGGDARWSDDPTDMESAQAPDLAPDAEFDRAWACAALDQTLTLLQQEQHATGKETVFAVLKPWLAGTASHGDTAEAARQLGTSETAIRVQLSRLRKRMRGLLYQTLADTLCEGGDVEAEMRHLAEALR